MSIFSAVKKDRRIIFFSVFLIVLLPFLLLIVNQQTRLKSKAAGLVQNQFDFLIRPGLIKINEKTGEIQVRDDNGVYHPINNKISKDYQKPERIEKRNAHPGWPVWTKEPISGDDSIFSSPLFADLNNDGVKEFLIASAMPDNRVYVIAENGQDMPGWPIKLSEEDKYVGHGSLSIADIDKDGYSEVIVHGTTNMYVFNYLGQLLPGWPVRIRRDTNIYGFWEIPPAVVADINKDGNLEIIVAHFDNALHVYNINGSELPGWPILFPYEGIEANRFAPAVADLDNDGFKEIVYATQYTTSSYNQYLYVYKFDGTDLSGWPKIFPYNTALMTSPVVVNLDNAGDPEIVIGMSNLINYFGKITAYHIDGSEVNGWPLIYNRQEKSYPSKELATADINNDGYSEVIAAIEVMNQNYSPSHNKLIAADKDGRLLWVSDPTKQYGGNNSPVIADLDNDGRKNIIIATGRYWAWDTKKAPGDIVVYDHDGRINTNLSFRSLFPFSMTPVVEDINGDGKVELGAATSNGQFNVWDYSNSSPLVSWPMYRYNNQRTGKAE